MKEKIKRPKFRQKKNRDSKTKKRETEGNSLWPRGASDGLRTKSD